MVTDDERRYASARLREYVPGKTDSAVGVWYGVLDICGANLHKTTRRQQLDRLADLIEPSEPKTKCVAEVKIDGEQLEKLANEAVAKVTGIDRDALLAMAEEMVGYADGACYEGSGTVNAGCLWSYADRIREALGVTQG